jgi:hypothetical protein
MDSRAERTSLSSGFGGKDLENARSSSALDLLLRVEMANVLPLFPQTSDH